MRNYLILFVFSCITPLFAQELNVVEHQLDNGLKLFIYEDARAPSVACRVVYRVGSADEWAGITGTSHLSEHLMFKGSTTLGTADYDSEIALLKREDDLRETMQLLEDDARTLLEMGEEVPPEMLNRIAALRAECEKVQADLAKASGADKGDDSEEDSAQEQTNAHSESSKSSEIHRLYTQAGGTGQNAFTTFNQTQYMVNLPPEKVELFFWIESDRLSNPVFRQFYKERDNVTDERLMRVENASTKRASEAMLASLFEASGYHTPTVGWPSDLERHTRPMLLDYWRTFYRPSNMAIVLGGAIKPARAIELAEKYFSRIENPDRPLPKRVSRDLPPEGSRTLTSYDRSAPIVLLAWSLPPASHRDMPAIELMVSILQGQSGPLRKRFVDTGMALAAGASILSTSDAGVLFVYAVLNFTDDPREFRPKLQDALEEIMLGGISDDDMTRVRSAIVAQGVHTVQTAESIASLVASGYVGGDWRDYFKRKSAAARLTADDISTAASEWLVPKKCFTVYILPSQMGVARTKELPLPELPTLPEEDTAKLADEAIEENRKRFPKVHGDAARWYEELKERAAHRRARQPRR